MRILAIDEDATQRKLIGLLAQRAGVLCMAVENCEQALEELLRTGHEYVAIVVDLGVPKDDSGIACVDSLKWALRSRNLKMPILAVTACAMAGDREKCLAAGMDDYLSKPFSIQQFEKFILRWLPKRDQEKAS